MLVIKFLLLFQALLAIYMVYKADFLTVTAGLSAILAVLCIFVALMI